MKKVLIANRGEIAVRVIRACRELGLRTVAVHSEADRGALHAEMADESVEIGPPSPLESYLRIDRVLQAARDRGADALHPGYGFLAENPELAEACGRDGLTFVGPSAATMRLMGDKVAARARMEKAGLPIIPGTGGGDDPGALAKKAAKLEFPVVVKASAGGGGKGMRVVHDKKTLPQAIAAASKEAEAAFGDARVYAERYLANPRHVEVQVLGDGLGNVVHLYERECSIQRRHQKLVEETPSPALDEKLRDDMGAAARAVAEEVGYEGAGTVEFLLDDRRRFYFLEMNTRIQVEHPITEAITGIDLVAWQLRIARGEKLGFEQASIPRRGHAIECRIYAEDPAQGFIPSSGRIARLELPWGPGVRVDAGIREGTEVTPHYDPILAKIIVHAEDRERARARMMAALEDTAILGVKTPISLLHAIMGDAAFARGETHTGFLAERFPWAASTGSESEAPRPGGETLDALLVAAAIAETSGAAALRSRASVAAPVGGDPHASPWVTIGPWRIGGV